MFSISEKEALAPEYSKARLFTNEKQGKDKSYFINGL